MRSRPIPAHTGSVFNDWRMPLKGDTSHAYLKCIHRLEITYAMFSVNLDEAFGIRRSGNDSKAHRVLSVAPDLCDRLAGPLHSVLHAMLEHAKHFGVALHLAPLNPKHFQNPRSQRVARLNDLFSKVLLTRKSQFLHKISALADLVDELNSSFESTVEFLTTGESIHAERDWDLLDAVHYDLNTCVRESVVLLKSFLHALPEAQLTAFHASLATRVAASSASIPVRARHLAHRRMAFLKGQ